MENEAKEKEKLLFFTPKILHDGLVGYLFSKVDVIVTVTIINLKLSYFNI